MSALKEIELQQSDGAVKDLALIGQDDSIWLVVPVRWYDLATLVWWLFAPADRRANVKLTMFDGKKVSFKAIRVASRHVRIRGFK